jgi:hypothetical protein
LTQNEVLFFVVKTQLVNVRTGARSLEVKWEMSREPEISLSDNLKKNKFVVDGGTELEFSPLRLGVLLVEIGSTMGRRHAQAELFEIHRR